MGKAYRQVPPAQVKFIQRQKMFFVGTANLDKDGHVNISPKGYDCFLLLDPKTFVYLDLTGSGSETAAHLMQKDNGRITIMFISYAKGTYIIHDEVPEELLRHFPKHLVESPGFRGLVRGEIHRVSFSCGYAVPYYDYKSDRDTYWRFANSKSHDYIAEYKVKKNSFSIDKVPSLGRVVAIVNTTVYREEYVQYKDKRVQPKAAYGHQQPELKGEKVVCYPENGYWFGKKNSKATPDDEAKVSSKMETCIPEESAGAVYTASWPVKAGSLEPLSISKKSTFSSDTLLKILSLIVLFPAVYMALNCNSPGTL
eukprot:jgi/Bigna1/69300/fgenesh1_pg.8_\